LGELNSPFEESPQGFR